MTDIKKRTCWYESYTSIMIINVGCNRQEIINRILTLHQQNENIFNLDLSCDDCIRFDTTLSPEESCKTFCDIDSEIIVYAATHWDNSFVLIQQDNKPYTEYDARYSDDTPQLNEDGTSDIDIRIMDRKSLCAMDVGGGMCSPEDTERYRSTVFK